ncbi:hypothetical protein [Streptomyces rubiginosohelvolus]|uniref:hypothetical protein n=1 Tax=Streptomyces rubiginosohelvolus TaxID=67362 RepID=UPI00371DEC75
MTVPATGKPRLLGHADERVPESAPDRPQPRDISIHELIETITIIAPPGQYAPQALITHDAYVN